ncbi:MAG: hypothetical protein CO065_07065, partial [Comamonadaceae bacterium CG_4_9_14_0_8_um_filter_57_21]
MKIKFMKRGLLAAVGALALAGCMQPGGQLAANAPVKGVVENGSEDRFQKIPGATVWLIPAADVAAMAKTPIEVKK